MDENKNQDWMSIFNDPLNQNNNGGNATSEEGKTEMQNTSSQTVGMGQPVPEGGVVWERDSCEISPVCIAERILCCCSGG